MKLRKVSQLVAVAIVIALPMVSIAGTTVVHHWVAPGGSVTTVQHYGPYYGYRPGPCCYYGGAAAAGAAAGLIVGAAIASKPTVVYAPPPVVTYATPTIIYTTPPPIYRVP
ncbi:hypothetical protein [Dyella flagellata]|uniref:Transmembrane protein n=1 Tax=Dyella flagellata TaxID=1867833 RepID=A0ABQ5X5F5_9GAMM|nr:hypothetical protein [Dyella flagellata]GLQ86827.1 hypothetical protein GCM10007898_03930 [Dyella flagellata]